MTSPSPWRSLRRAVLGLTLTAALVAAAGVAFILYQTRDEIGARPETVEGLLAELHHESKLAGFSVAVFDADGVRYRGGFGFSDLEERKPFTPRTAQRIASISKTTIGLALLKAQELGHLDIDDPVDEHLPFPVSNPAHPDAPITLRHLATHTSSLDYNEAVVESLYVDAVDGPVDPSLRDFMRRYFVDGAYGDVRYGPDAPGDIFGYSNIGAALAAFAVERAASTDFASFTREHLFDPLGLASADWFGARGEEARYYTSSPDRGLEPAASRGVVLYPARDLILHVDDLARYGRAVLAKDPDLLSARSFEQLLAPGLDASVRGRTVDNSGLFWMIDRNQYGVTHSLVGMNGGDDGINTMLWLDPVLGVGYAFLGNTGASELNRVRHILIFQTLASLGNHLALTDPERTGWQRLRLRAHMLYSRVAGLF
ncbi:MAG: serine hydrolase domain-containing protein [Acidobacteriota bacterium]